MRSNRKLIWTLVMLVVVALAMSPVASAKDTDKPVKIKRDSKEVNPGAPSTSFGEVNPKAEATSCSGSCNCSSCSCSGSLGCCLDGCDACWDYRDSQGLCNNAT